MVHAFKNTNTRFKTFVFDNNINQSELIEIIAIEALKKNKFPISWATLNRYIHGKNPPRLDFMHQIKDGLDVYLGRDVKLCELFEL